MLQTCVPSQPQATMAASVKHPDPPKEQSEHRAKVGLTQGMLPQDPQQMLHSQRILGCS